MFPEVIRCFSPVTSDVLIQVTQPMAIGPWLVPQQHWPMIQTFWSKCVSLFADWLACSCCCIIQTLILGQQKPECVLSIDELHAPSFLSEWDLCTPPSSLQPRAHFGTGPQQKHRTFYEFRTYCILPDQNAAFLKLTNEKIHLRTAHSELVGYWSVEYGGLNKAFHIWKYGEDLFLLLSHNMKVFLLHGAFKR